MKKYFGVIKKSLIMNELVIKEIRDKLNVTQGQLAKMVGVSERTVQNWESGGVIPKSKHEILRSLQDMKLKPQTYAGGCEVDKETVLLLPLAAQGGTLNEFVLSVNECDCEKIISPVRGADFAITVSGESMSPEYPSGSQVLIKKIDEHAFINWGHVFVLDTRNGVVVKRLYPSECPEKITCKSINPDYPPFDVDMKDVFGIYRVLVVMSKKIMFARVWTK